MGAIVCQKNMANELIPQLRYYIFNSFPDLYLELTALFIGNISFRLDYRTYILFRAEISALHWRKTCCPNEKGFIS